MSKPFSGPIKAIMGNGTLTTQYIVHFSAAFQISAAVRRGGHVTCTHANVLIHSDPNWARDWALRCAHAGQRGRRRAVHFNGRSLKQWLRHSCGRRPTRERSQ